MKTALVLGAGGFIGSHMVESLKKDNFTVVGADLKLPEYSISSADKFYIGNLCNYKFMKSIFDEINYFDEIYQFAADMGGAGYIFTGDNDLNIMTNSCQININLVNILTNKNSNKIFYSSSACIYPAENQMDPNNPICSENSAYPANPDSEYGWEKLFSERLYLSALKNKNLNIHIARYHNIYGPMGTFDGGKEKAPAALCRKILKTTNNQIEVWGDGNQTRSFLYIDDCIDATKLLIRSNFSGPVNIGSEEMVTINTLIKYICEIDNKNINIKYIDGPQGVRGRSSDNNLISKELNWNPSINLKNGIFKTYNWIKTKIC